MLSLPNPQSKIGCPALAGIDRFVVITVGFRYRLPRTRGDRPDSRHWHGSMEEAAPHSRG